MAFSPVSPELEPDINDIFDCIALSEENVVASAYSEGFAKGIEDGDIEGFHLGYHKGSEIGHELGLSLGTATAWITLLGGDHLSNNSKKVLNEKTVKILNRIVEEVEAFPSENCSSVNVSQERDKIIALHKRVCSLLKSKDNKTMKNLPSF
ncbi:protein LTO1 homolog [Hetaerina americana]|uniref:protein LTO1 homolog n=1 Tax=Hetaerina americana TaxID=62018 RepID=UPI003A7F4756